MRLWSDLVSRKAMGRPSVREVIGGMALAFTDQTVDEMIAALRAHGYVVVPCEPTERMIDAGIGSTAAHLNIEGSALTVNREKMRIRYRAMIEAA